MTQRQGRRTREETRLLLLETAREVMLEEGLPEGTNIKLTSVLEQAGLTTGAAYQVWKSQQVFQEDLALFVARQFEWARPALDSVAILKALPASAKPSADGTNAAVHAFALAYYDAFVNRPEFLMVLHYWGIQSPRPELTEAIRDGYEIVHGGLVETCGELLDRCALTCTEPGTIDDLAVAVLASAEGLVLRRHFDHERVGSGADTASRGEHLFVKMIEGIFDRFTNAATT